MGRLFRFSTPDGENVALSNANSGNNTICKGGVIGIGNDSAADAVVLKRDCGRLAWTVSVDRDRLQVSRLAASAFSHRLVILAFAVTATARLLTAMMNCVHRRPGTAFSFIFRDATSLVAFLNMPGLSFLLVRVFVFVSSWHLVSSFDCN